MISFPLFPPPQTKAVRLLPNGPTQPHRPCMAGLERSLFSTLEFEREAWFLYVMWSWHIHAGTGWKNTSDNVCLYYCNK
jgi:hypothetical protein